MQFKGIKMTGSTEAAATCEDHLRHVVLNRVHPCSQLAARASGCLDIGRGYIGRCCYCWVTKPFLILLLSCGLCPASLLCPWSSSKILGRLLFLLQVLPTWGQTRTCIAFLAGRFFTTEQHGTPIPVHWKTSRAKSKGCCWRTRVTEQKKKC